MVEGSAHGRKLWTETELVDQTMEGWLCAKDGLSLLKWLILVKVVELHETGYMYSYYDWY